MHKLRGSILAISLQIIIFVLNSSCMDNCMKELLVYHNVFNFSHDIVCTFACVDKIFNKLICATALSRKNYLENYVKGSNIPIFEYKSDGGNNTFDPVLNEIIYSKNYTSQVDMSILNDKCIKWHKYGSACSFIERPKNTLNSWYFKFFYITDGGFIKERSYHDYNKLYQWPHDKTPPFFDDKGQVCFYRVTDGQFYEISIGMEGTIKEIPCLIDLKDWEYTIWLHYLFNFIKFPNILNAILNSGKGCEEKLYIYHEFRKRDKDFIGKVYCIENIMIPDNYDICIPFNKDVDVLHGKSLTLINKFDDLEFSAQGAIHKRYKAQKCSSIIEYLPKIIIEKIGSMIKRIGRDAFRCVSKACNEIMWSQDELNSKLSRYIMPQKYIEFYLGFDEDEQFYEKCGAWIHPFFELKDALKNKVASLALITWFMKNKNMSFYLEAQACYEDSIWPIELVNRWFMSKDIYHCFHKEEWVIIAAETGNIAVVDYFLSNTDNPRRIMFFVVKSAAQHGQNAVLQYLHDIFYQLYCTNGYLRYVLPLAQKNGHFETVALIKQHIEDLKLRIY